MPAGEIYERPAAYGTGWVCGDPVAYDREYCVDLAQLAMFLRATQPDVAETLDLAAESPTRHKFLARLQGEINRRGTVDVLRNGVKHGAHALDLFLARPRPATSGQRHSTARTAFR